MNVFFLEYFLLTVTCFVLMDQGKSSRSCGLRSFPCVLCQKRTKPGERRYVCGDAYNSFRKYLFKNFMIKVKETDVSCSRCRNKYYRSNQASSNTVSDDVVYQPPAKRAKQDLCSPKHISLPFQSVKGPSHSSCCICKRRGHKFVVVPSCIRNNVFIEKNVIVPAGSRCCPGHIDGDLLKDDAMKQISDLKSECQFNRTDIFNLLQQVRAIALKNQNKRIDFDSDSFISDADYYNLLGLSRGSFDDICSHITDIRNTKNRSLRTCIGL
ncbi:unnamed protein product [Mytilus coruscus]|uniref:Uncharacterized protein n=1 Tax=Mytilus coruscus TaxID=42192 RepID=A0A6J8C585_MYTCO|nr:unnamed protein product [Mytilus coruscus]